MIRIFFISLLTLTLSCGNMRPEPVDTPVEPAVAEAAAKPRAESTDSSQPETVVAPVKTAAPARAAAPRPAKNAAVATLAVPATSSTVTTEEKTAESTAPASVTPAATQPDVSSEMPAGSAAATADTTESAAATTEAPLLVPMSAPAATSSGTALALQSTDKPVLASRKHFLPTRRRIDREINKLKFAYKGEVMIGLTASYGTLSSDNTDFLAIFNDITADATIASVKPFFGYFYHDNHAVGIRFGYNHVGGTLNSAGFDLGPSNDLSGTIPYIDLKSDNYAFGIFHRSYAGLDPKGRFGLFAEFELSVATGTSEFTYEQNNVLKSSFSDNMQVKLSFNPGAAVYIFPNVCATLSFGLGGVQYTSVTQKDENGNKIGTRKASKMNFKLNIAAINIGMNVHLWDKKKK